MAENYHIFRDPIHGYIIVHDVEMDIIDSLPFQRLRHVSQLGLSYLIYHGAEHTRFGHSLGVMNFSNRIYDSLTKRYRSLIKEKFHWNDDDFTLNLSKLRLAALLHDIGHAPFSHASEELFPIAINGKQLDHTDYGELIVAESEINDIINKHQNKTGISHNDVLNLISKKTLGSSDNLLKQILASEIDADRMDYLLRDSKYTGVQYGMYDSDRLIETLGIYEKDDGTLNIGVEERGLHAAEGLLLARYFMFLQVYFHSIRRVYDIHLTSLIREYLTQKTKYDRYPSEISTYLNIDDIDILSYAKLMSAKKKKSENARRIIERDHFVLILETSDHAQGGEITNFDRKIISLQETIGPNNLIVDHSLKAPYLYDYQKGEQKLCIIPPRSNPRDISLESKLVGNLPEIYKLRLYVHPSLENKAIPML